jgi:hypothetical protein
VDVLILLIPAGFWFFNISESENQQFWGSFFFDQNQKNHWLWLFEKPQRTRSFHERTSIEPVVLWVVIPFFKFLEICDYICLPVLVL